MPPAQPTTPRGSRPSDAPGQSGLIIVDKPAGLTSHDVVSRVRRLAGTRKVGHAGTLDPMATGVLVLGVNRATRLLGHLMLTQKRYDATVRLGAATDTDDAEGQTVSRAAVDSVSERAVHEALAGFVGDIDQVPSSVSAIKVGGRRAYAKVRAGESVALPARRVTIFSLQVTGVDRVAGFLDVDIAVTCSSGTYIRAIARDLGTMLAVGGHLTRLRRTGVGPFDLADAQALPSRDSPLPLTVVSLDDAARGCFPAQVVAASGAADVSHGRKLQTELGSSGPVAVFDEAGRFLALYAQQGPYAVPLAVFTGAG